MQDDIYCNMSVTLQLHVHLLITIIIFSGLVFQPDELSGSKHKNTHQVLWIIQYYHLQNAGKQAADD